MANGCDDCGHGKRAHTGPAGNGGCRDLVRGGARCPCRGYAGPRSRPALLHAGRKCVCGHPAVSHAGDCRWELKAGKKCPCARYQPRGMFAAGAVRPAPAWVPRTPDPRETVREFDAVLVRQTPLAMLCRVVDGPEVWVPRSQVVAGTTCLEVGLVGVLAVSEWWVVKSGSAMPRPRASPTPGWDPILLGA